MSADFEVVGTKYLPPDPAVVDAIGLNHALDSAVADLVDNSIDARARNVLIRFIRADGRLVSLLVVDDGDGMDEAAIDDAMTVGRRRRYGVGSLGHFGMGLKAASLSQAGILTVLSRRADSEAVGRRWVLKDAREGFHCAVLAEQDTERYLDTTWGPLMTTTGTVVRWDDVHSFPGSSAATVTTGWLERTITALRHRLGLVFHRLGDRGDVSILLDVLDADSSESGPLHRVHPIDPFGYPRSGAPDYPKVLVAHHRGHAIELVCHIWPRSDAAGFRLPGSTPLRHQGFYFYRHDRLLQPGGWNGVHLEDRKLQLARVAVDIDGEVADLLTMNSEKNAVTARPAFASAVEQARAGDGTTFETFLHDAQEARRHSSGRGKTRAPVVPPGKGLHPDVRRAVARHADMLPEDPLSVRWKPLADDRFFKIDRSTRTIWLNSRYLDAALRDRTSSVNDVPLVKALVYLLMQSVFEGSYLGPKDRADIAWWETVLTAAARAEVTS